MDFGEIGRVNPLVSDDLRKKLLGDVPTLGSISGEIGIGLPIDLPGPFGRPVVVEGRQEEEEDEED